MIGGHGARTSWRDERFMRRELGGECCVLTLDECCCQTCDSVVDVFPGDNGVISLMLSALERDGILCQHGGQAAGVVNVTHGDIALRAGIFRMGRHGHLSVGRWRGGQRCRDHRELIGGDLNAIAAIEGGPCCYRLRGKEAIVKGDRAHRHSRPGTSA